MSDIVSLGRRVTNLDVSPQFTNYSKVRIIVSGDTAIEAGNDSGRTLEMTNPFGTQAMAQNILASLSRYQYQPYYAQGALMDPAAEIGDAANIRGVYGGIFARSKTFGRLMSSDISAPHDEEINHEYAFESPTERQFKRQIDDVRASLRIANDRIDASVSKTGGEQSSFGWALTSDAHRWYANGQEVMSVTASGLTVKGNVQATSGTIGGFTIGASALYNNMPSMSATQTRGVYLGTDGIKLGQAFRVDSTGGVTATRLAVDTLYIGGAAVSASDLNSRASQGSSAYGWTSSNGSYVRGGAGYGYSYNSATINGTSSYPSYFTCGRLNAKTAISVGGYNFSIVTLNYKDHSGNNRTMTVLSGQR